MNRESAYKLNTHITGVLQAKRWKEAVDKIFDDIAEQTCSNRKFTTTCPVGKSHFSEDNLRCDEWEKQDDIKRS